jgi:nucleoid-associated protein YgaU
MSSRNKIAVGLCVVFGLLTLIVFDLAVAPHARPQETRSAELIVRSEDPVVPQEPKAAAAPPPEPAAQTPPVKLPDSEPPKKPPRTYKVKPNDSLWKIAFKHAPTRSAEMVDKIFLANRDKLKTKSTQLKVGWELVVPE